MKNMIVIILVAGIVLGLGVAAYIGFSKPGKYDQFVTCLSDSEVLMYGAFWCGHCEEQKKLFGKSAMYLPYVECSTPDRKQTQICKDENIQSYPVWQFKGNEKQNGFMTLDQLATKSGCALPP